MNISDPKATQTLPKVEGCPEDFTYRTTLLNKGKLAPTGYVWLEMRIRNYAPKSGRSVGVFIAPMMKGLTKEQKQYFAQKMRLKIENINNGR